MTDALANESTPLEASVISLLFDLSALIKTSIVFALLGSAGAAPNLVMVKKAAHVANFWHSTRIYSSICCILDYYWFPIEILFSASIMPKADVNESPAPTVSTSENSPS